MNEGDIALAPLPQADGQIKTRPVVLLRRLPPFGDFLVCGVSSQLHQGEPRLAHVLLASPDEPRGAGPMKTTLSATCMAFWRNARNFTLPGQFGLLVGHSGKAPLRSDVIVFMFMKHDVAGGRTLPGARRQRAPVASQRAHSGPSRAVARRSYCS